MYERIVQFLNEKNFWALEMWLNVALKFMEKSKTMPVWKINVQDTYWERSLLLKVLIE